ncbi:hypothetical protein AA313_de0200702 [Arthrobotrys entomopaga]|nr:hypothetical protein AA313_de0200702 [Arthrobotrys entomopaga]
MPRFKVTLQNQRLLFHPLQSSAAFHEIRSRHISKMTSSNNTEIDTDNSIYFWKPDRRYGYLGQWYPSVFKDINEDGEEVIYQNAEQYMMHQKGVLFAPDDPVTAEILTAKLSPRTIKALGRQVPNFDEETWGKKRFEIVVKGNYLKFTQNEDLKKQLLETGNKELVEASPRDKIWGVGFGIVNAPSQRARWGLNLLGKALMEVRETIRKEAEGPK